MISETNRKIPIGNSLRGHMLRYRAFTTGHVQGVRAFTPQYLQYCGDPNGAPVSLPHNIFNIAGTPKEAPRSPGEKKEKGARACGFQKRKGVLE